MRRALPVLALAATLLTTTAFRQATAAPGPFCVGLKTAVAAQMGDDEAAFVRSYLPANDESELPAGLSTSAFTYDNALTVIALVACDDVAAARPIGRALGRAVRRDRTFADGRLRNAYRAGAVGEKAPDLPGWWDRQAKLWAEDAAQDGTSTGNVAWGVLALLTLHAADGDGSYLDDARRAMDWIIDGTACAPVGFCGGFHGYDSQQVRLTWTSTEHNADVAAAALWLHQLTGERRYSDAAALARHQIDASFRGDHFLLGTKPDGSPADEGRTALDVQLWPWMAIAGSPPAWRKALSFSGQRLGVEGGYDFNEDRDGIWIEGTAQAALAHRIASDGAAADRLLAGLAGDRTPSGLLMATRNAKLTTGLSIDPTGAGGSADFLYYRRPHLGATAWAALAEARWNPFTGKRVP